MKENARLFVTYNGGRNYPECFSLSIREIYSVKALGGYKKVALTGGELFLYPGKLMKLIKQLKKVNKHCEVYIYTECLDLRDYEKILNLVDGITVTLSANATDEDIRNLKYMSEYLYGEDIDMSLFIDKEVYNRYDLRNIRMETWDVVGALKYIPAANEELLYMQI